MAAGKNKKLGKKKGAKKKVDPFIRKEWYDLKAPTPFTKRTFGMTAVTKTTGTRIASDQLKGRVVETALSDLNDKSETLAWRKVRLAIEEVQGRSCLTNFHGMSMTRDKICSYLKKWQSLIESTVEVKTSDGYILRLFIVAFTGRQQGQIRKCSYAQTAQIKLIRKKIQEVVAKEASGCNLTDLVNKFCLDSFSEQCKKACQYVYPLSHVILKSVKTLKKPKFDLARLNELYKDAPKTGNTGAGAKGKAKKGEAGSDETKNLLAQ